MKKTKESVLRQLESDYEKTCNAWVVELARMWGTDCRNGHWIGGEPGGDFDFDGEWALSLRDIMYIVRNGITYEKACEWHEYASWCIDREECGFEVPCLQDYVEGLVPLLDTAARERIDAKFREIEQMKEELIELCEEESEKADSKFFGDHTVLGEPTDAK